MKRKGKTQLGPNQIISFIKKKRAKSKKLKIFVNFTSWCLQSEFDPNYLLKCLLYSNIRTTSFQQDLAGIMELCRDFLHNKDCSAQTRTGIGLLEKAPAVNRFPAVESHLGVRVSYATRPKRRYEANKCG
jgi:hypothetical protein